MPNQDNTNQNQSNTQPASPPTGQPTDTPPSVPTPTDIPIVPDMGGVPPGPVVPQINQPTTDSGSAAPSDIPPVVSPPKKKFGGGRIIATILGILLLVGGVGAGIVLTQQQQLFQQKAGGCPSGYYACNKKGGCCQVFTGNPLPSSGTGGTSGTANLGGGTTGGASGTTNIGAPTPNPFAGVSGSAGGLTPQPSPLAGVSGTAGGKTPTPGPLGGVSGTAGGKTPTPGPLSNVSGSAGGTGPLANVTGTAGGIVGSCSSDSQCANGYVCGSNKTCVPDPTKSAVGGAPIGCNRGCSSGDYVCENPGARLECKTTDYTGATKWCLIESNSSQCGAGGGTTTITTVTGPTAQCSTVLAYNSSYSPLTSSQLSALTAGTTINFCVGGSASSGSFDKAKFTINGTAQAETTTVRPGSTDFCQSYQIPSGVTSFSVSAQIHHVTLGWSI